MLASFATEAISEPKKASDVIKKTHILNLFDNPLPAFEKKLAKTKVVDLTEEEKEKIKINKLIEGGSYVSNDPKANITTADKTPSVRINPEAPGAFKVAALASQQGDMKTARAYSRQFVRYMRNLSFEVRKLTNLIGEALVEEDVIDEEEWVGAEQYMSIQFAHGRKDEAVPFKPEHKEAMKRVVPDPNNKAEIYYFFSLSSKWAREMSPDVERLWRIAKKDPRLKMVALSLGPSDPKWVEEYRRYTGLTIPIVDGEAAAKSLRIGFVPSIVVVSPTKNTSYLKTGQQSFERLYEFVRTVQGLSPEMTPEIAKLKTFPIGEKESGRANYTASNRLHKISAPENAWSASEGLQTF